MVGESRKKRACAVDGRARAARRTSCLSRLSGVSRVCRHQGSSGLIFMYIIESGEGVVERDAGHLPARKSHGEVTARRIAARCVGGLTAIRSASTKWSTACPATRSVFQSRAAIAVVGPSWEKNPGPALGLIAPISNPTPPELSQSPMYP